MLISQGRELYKRILADTELPADVMLPEKRPEAFPITSGGMFNFVNKVSEMDISNTSIETKYGNMSLKREEDLATLIFNVNTEKLDSLKEILGNIEKVGFEHGGFTYIWEDPKTGWEVFVDIDKEKMLEVSPQKPLTVTMLKSGKEVVIEATL